MALSIASRLARKVFGSKNDRELKRLRPFVQEINALEPQLEAESADQLRARLAQWREKLSALADPEEREEAMAIQLVQAMQAPFRPEAYLNRERAEWLRRVEEQRQQGVVRPPQAADLGTPVAELLDRLAQSLKATQRAQAAPTRRARGRRASGSGR